jgi:hypothetical protein
MANFLQHPEEPYQISITEIRSIPKRSHGKLSIPSTTTRYLYIAGTIKRGASSRFFCGPSLHMVYTTRHRSRGMIKKFPYQLLHAEPRLSTLLKPLLSPTKKPRLISRGANPPSPFFEEPKHASHSDPRPIFTAEPRLQTLATEVTNMVAEPWLYSTKESQHSLTAELGRVYSNPTQMTPE